jgi:hypothetical protein
MRPVLEVADIFRRHAPAYRRDRQGSLGRVETRVMRAVELCRTAALGGHLEACGDCSHTRIAYNSCRNRHCPKCQGPAREAWLDERQKDLLPTPYFHVVFTVPAAIGAVAFQNKAVVYAILFEAALWTLKTIAADRNSSAIIRRRSRLVALIRRKFVVLVRLLPTRSNTPRSPSE